MCLEWEFGKDKKSFESGLEIGPKIVEIKKWESRGSKRQARISLWDMIDDVLSAKPKEKEHLQRLLDGYLDRDGEADKDADMSHSRREQTTGDDEIYVEQLHAGMDAVATKGRVAMTPVARNLATRSETLSFNYVVAFALALIAFRLFLLVITVTT
ncbi:hypothetical protein B0H63DRAFT_455277 [Podospora didyma]|uniref:Uncharacterized protein n=1 Tax=Podospora didyma TaxID=330526 RepID=A0AAE0N381_9PEZI|nr:hypothetical protein B0H63DRAFT_455277 [Podospora didyma]